MLGYKYLHLPVDLPSERWTAVRTSLFPSPSIISFMYRWRRFNNARFTVSSLSRCVGRVLQTRFRVLACAYKPAWAGNGLQTCMLSKCKQERGKKAGWFGISRRTLCTWAEFAPAVSFGQYPRLAETIFNASKLPVNMSDCFGLPL